MNTVEYLQVSFCLLLDYLLAIDNHENWCKGPFRRYEADKNFPLETQINTSLIYDRLRIYFHLIIIRKKKWDNECALNKSSIFKMIFRHLISYLWSNHSQKKLTPKFLFEQISMHLTKNTCRKVLSEV